MWHRKSCLRSPAGEVMGRLHGYELAALLPEVGVRCWASQQGLQPLPHPLAVISSSSDGVQLCNFTSGCCGKTCEKRCWGLSPFVHELYLSSDPGLNYTAHVPVLGCVLLWPWPCLPDYLGPAPSLRTCLVSVGLWLTPVNATGPALLAQGL